MRVPLPFVALLLVPVIVHSIFHLLDWIVWGLGLPSLAPREILSPFFQDSTPLGLAVHAGVNIAVLVAIAVLLAMVVRLRALRDVDRLELP